MPINTKHPSSYKNEKIHLIITGLKADSIKLRMMDHRNFIGLPAIPSYRTSSIRIVIQKPGGTYQMTGYHIRERLNPGGILFADLTAASVRLQWLGKNIIFGVITHWRPEPA